MSNIKELIRAEIDRRYEENREKARYDDYYRGMNDGLDHFEQFLDTLPDESEQPARGYDEAYLNEKIAKASKSWEGVDVDKFMDEIRGREKTVTDCHDLTEAAAFEYERTRNDLDARSDNEVARRAFKAGAKWMKKQMPMPEDTVLFQKGVEEGKRLMMEGAEECELYWDGDFLAIDLNMRVLGYSERDKVRIIILPKED